VKWSLLLLVIAGSAEAALLATMQTSRGNVVIELQYTKAPQAVANFITLSQGTRAWVDPRTGAVRKTPFYNGLNIHRTVDQPNFKIIQGGSPKGDGTDGPGYTFKDEFDPSLTHVPYVFSMANSGPNTNGSQFFFTGNVSIPSLNNVHTIFGLVTDPASRAVIDAMLAAGANLTTISAVSIYRTDPAAVAFNEFGQNLPLCSGVAGRLSVIQNTSADYVMNSPWPSGTTFQAYRSSDLKTWTKLGEIYQGLGLAGVSSINLDSAALPKAFYQLPLVTYSDALGPQSLANRTLVMGLSGTQTFTFQFNAAGTGGTATYSQNPSQPTTITSVSYSPLPHRATWIISTAAYNPLRIKAALNTSNATQILGSNVSEQWNGLFWNGLSSGTLSLTK
jgi:cyclophilin family peptidyl-prolyl cis-trans isomerase